MEKIERWGITFFTLKLLSRPWNFYNLFLTIGIKKQFVCKNYDFARSHFVNLGWIKSRLIFALRYKWEDSESSSNLTYQSKLQTFDMLRNFKYSILIYLSNLTLCQVLAKHRNMKNINFVSSHAKSTTVM